MMSQKRERSVNFTRDEIDILVKLVDWDFDEEERQHKREMWALEKEIMLKKFNEQ